MPHPSFTGDISRSQDFRTHFTNAFGIQFNGHELILTCALTIDNKNPKAGVEEQVAIAMTAFSAKQLMVTLRTVVEQFERATKQTIPVSPELTALLEQAVKDANAEVAKAK